MKVARPVRRADRRNPPTDKAKGRSGPTQRTVTRYKWVVDRKAEGFPITMACRAADVSRQAFCDWQTRETAGPTPAQLAEVALVEVKRDIADDFDGTYGEPRMTVELAIVAIMSTRNGSHV